MKDFFKLIVFFSLIVTATSCNSFASPPRTQSTEVMETALFVARTSIPATQAAIPTLTFTPILTQTPTQIPTATLTLTSKQIFYGTADAFFITAQAEMVSTRTSGEATLQARNIQCKDGFGVEQHSEVLRASSDTWTIFTCSPSSPNGDDAWTPGVVDYGTRYTQIIKNDLSKIWTIQHNIFDYSIIDRPMALMTPYWWTADGKYLYFYPRYYPGGSGFPQSSFLYTLINDLYSVNLETGEFKLFLKTEDFGALAFSPNDKFLAYSELDEPDAIHIRNLDNGNDLQVKLNENIIASGAFVWNLDSTKVIFSTGYEKQNKDGPGNLSSTSIYVLTLQNMQIQKVLAKDPRIFQPHECSENIIWLDEKTMCLYSINQELESWNKFFTFNIQTGEVVFLRSFP